MYYTIYMSLILCNGKTKINIRKYNKKDILMTFLEHTYNTHIQVNDLRREIKENINLKKEN